MSASCFNVEIKDNIAHIQLSRPEKRNSMILQFWDELPAIVREIDHQVQARVIVISSTGPHFSAGLDLQAFFEADKKKTGDERTRQITRGAHFYHNIKRMQDTFSVLEESRIPVIAAVQGGCIGGGVDLVTACDLRYATEDAFFSVEEINAGMTADVGTFPRLCKLLPEGLVRELCYTGRPFSAAQAQSSGLVNGVFADQSTLLEEVFKVAAQIAAKAPLALHGCKRMITYSRDHSTADSLDYVRLWNASMFQQAEIIEAITARAEKRAGKFVDLPVIEPSVG